MYTRFFITAFVSLLLSAQSVKSADVEINYFATLPNEALAEIVTWAYIDYNDPVEFTRLKSVCMVWRAIINQPFFKKSCAEKGFAEPVMVFYELSLDQRGSDTLKTDINADDQVTTCDEVWATRKNTVKFRYTKTSKMKPDSYFSGFFWRGDSKNLAIWVNPAKTIVYNDLLSITANYSSMYHASCMTLEHYIKQFEKSEKLKANNKNTSLWISRDPITAEPDLKKLPKMTSYDEAALFITAPVPPSKFVKKWPSTVTFNAHQYAAYPSSNEFKLSWF